VNTTFTEWLGSKFCSEKVIKTPWALNIKNWKLKHYKKYKNNSPKWNKPCFIAKNKNSDPK